MAQFNADNYIWFTQTFIEILDEDWSDSEREAILEATEIFADILSERDRGFDPQLFMQNVKSKTVPVRERKWTPDNQPRPRNPRGRNIFRNRANRPH